jgi:hypothetical protein
MYTTLGAIAKATAALPCQLQLVHCTVTFSRPGPLLAATSPTRYYYEHTAAKPLIRQLLWYAQLHV